MELAKNIVLLIVGFVLLIKGADFFVEGASGFARKFGISELIIGLTIVAMGTSAPEAAVSITGAISGNADISIGNVVGSNLFNILFIIGLTGMIRPMNFAKNFISDGIVAIVAAILLWLLARDDRKVGRRDGLFLLGAYAAYFIYLILA